MKLPEESKLATLTPLYEKYSFVPLGVTDHAPVLTIEPADVAVVADVAVPALPVTLIAHVPDAPVPSALGAPMELYDIVFAADPLYVEPDASPDPLLFMVSEFVTAPAVSELCATY